MITGRAVFLASGAVAILIHNTAIFERYWLSTAIDMTILDYAVFTFHYWNVVRLGELFVNEMVILNIVDINFVRN